MPSPTTAEQQRIAALLWGARPRPGRGPARGLTVARIVEATVELIDEVGLDALSMRQVAGRLGVGAATLYTYVPGKAELLALVLDECAGQQLLPDELPGDWRSRIEAWARADYADYRARPWTLRLATGPIVAGPKLMRWYDSALRAVDGLGLEPAEMVAVVDSVDAFVRGQARSAQGEVGPPPAADGDADGHAEAFAPLFPSIARLAEEGAFGEPEATFEFGLQRLLDGIAALVAQRSPNGADAVRTPRRG